MHVEKSGEYMPNLTLAVELQESSSCFVYFYFRQKIKLIIKTKLGKLITYLILINSVFKHKFYTKNSSP